MPKSEGLEKCQWTTTTSATTTKNCDATINFL